MFAKITKSIINIDLVQLFRSGINEAIKPIVFSRRSGRKKLNSLIKQAVQNNKVALTQTLLEKGADVNLKVSSNKSLLHIAVEQKNQEMARLLIAHGADINLGYDEGNMWLWYNIFDKEGN